MTELNIQLKQDNNAKKNNENQEPTISEEGGSSASFKRTPDNPKTIALESDSFTPTLKGYENYWINRSIKQGELKGIQVGDQFQLSFDNPNLNPDYNADLLQTSLTRTGAYTTTAATMHATGLVRRLAEDGSKNRLTRTFISAATRRGGNRFVREGGAWILKKGGERVISKAGQSIAGKVIGKGASIALRNGARAVLVGAGACSMGTTIVLLVASEVGTYVVCEYVIPAINKRMDDSSLDVVGKNLVDKDGKLVGHRLYRNTYKDNTGRGDGQSTLFELDRETGRFTMGSSGIVQGKHFWHLWDSEERDDNIYPRAMEDARNSVWAQENNGSYSPRVYLTKFDEDNKPLLPEPVTVQRKLRIKDLEGKTDYLDNPQYQIMAAAELAKLSGLPDSASRSEVMKMMSTHLNLTNDKFNEVPSLDEVDHDFHTKVSLYQIYAEIYSQALQKYYDSRPRKVGFTRDKDGDLIPYGVPSYVQDLAKSLKNSQRFLKAYENHFAPAQEDLLDILSRTEAKIDRNISPRISSSQAENIIEYLNANTDSDFEPTDDLLNSFRISPISQRLEIDSSNAPINLFFNANNRRREFVQNDLRNIESQLRGLSNLPRGKIITINKTPEQMKQELEVVYRDNLRKAGLLQYADNQDLLKESATDLLEKAQLAETKKLKAIRILKSLRGQSSANAETYDSIMMNFLTGEALRAILSELSYIDAFSTEASEEKANNAKQKLVNKLADKISGDEYIRLMQEIPEDASKEEIREFIEMALDELIDRVQSDLNK